MLLAVIYLEWNHKCMMFLLDLSSELFRNETERRRNQYIKDKLLLGFHLLLITARHLIVISLFTVNGLKILLCPNHKRIIKYAYLTDIIPKGPV